MKMEKLKEYLLNLDEVLKKEEKEDNKNILKRKNVLLIFILKRPSDCEGLSEKKYDTITSILKLFHKNSSITNLNLSYSKGENKYLVLAENYSGHNIFFHIELIYYKEKKTIKKNNKTEISNDKDNIIIQLGTKIYNNFNSYNGFVIIHPDIFILHTISSLSFSLKNLSKPIIFLENKKNFHNKLFHIKDCLIIAGFFKIPEICFFNNQSLYRGNRVSYNINKNYYSPNYPSLGKIINSIFQPHWKYIKITPYIKKKLFFHYKNLNDVILLKLNPILNYEKLTKFFLNPKIRIIILSCYGAGNSPLNNKSFVNFIKILLTNKKIIFSITQCLKGYIENTYENSIQNFGVLLGYDIVENTALAKMTFLSGFLENDEILKKKSVMNLRGEISENFLTDSNKDKNDLEKELYEVIVKKELVLKSVRKNDTSFLMELNEEFWKSDKILEIKSKEKKNILHFLSKNGDENIIKFFKNYIKLENLQILLKEKDINFNIPLFHAIYYKNKKVFKYLLEISDQQEIINDENKDFIYFTIFECIDNLDLDRIKLFYYAGIKDFNSICNFNKMNIAHLAVFRDFKDLLIFLKNDIDNFDFRMKDVYGKTSIDYIEELKKNNLKDIF